MAHPVHDKKKLLARVRRIKGQVEALERAFDHEADCTSILQQIASMRGAVNGLMGEVMEGHLRQHVATAASVKQRLEDLDPVVQLLRTYMK